MKTHSFWETRASGLEGREVSEKRTYFVLMCRVFVCVSGEGGMVVFLGGAGVTLDEYHLTADGEELD